jgi:hypothetical protein
MDPEDPQGEREMSVVAKPGARLRSVTCATEVVVVKGAGEVDLRCGGAPMVPSDDPTTAGAPAAPFDEGTLVGKRYVTEDEAIELLCTKPGAGSLSLGDAALLVKGAKPLPSSD